ncbi:MAG: Crp/Fnr family transcriptional regulator [Betaproteobacteria bacterium]
MAGNGTATNGRDPRLIEGVLANLPLFRNVALPSVASVASHSRVLHVRRGATICERGAQLPGVFVMVYGTAKISLQRGNGEEKVVRFLFKGESFGESAALHDRPCPVGIVALEDSMLVVVPPLPLLALIEQDTRFARNLVRLLSEKFLGLLAELESGLRHSALERLAGFLDSLEEPGGESGAWVVRLPVSKTAVAARLGITKETLSRLLAALAERGLINVERHQIEIHDRAELRKLAR